MSLAAIIFSGQDWLVWALVLVLPAVALMLWGYRYPAVDLKVRLGCAVLKLTGLLLLAACLLEPMWSGQRARPGANYFVILADNSEGMRVKDPGEDKTRGELLHGLLTADSAEWQTRLSEDFQVRRYLFDSRLQSTRDLGDLVFDGRSSSLVSALRTLGQRFRGQPLAGVLLFTDGNATDVEGDALPSMEGLPPIYPVVSGKDIPIRDLSIQRLAVSQTSFEDAPVTVQVQVGASGLGKTNVTTRLVDAAGKVVKEESQPVSPERSEVSFRFQIRPPASGLHFYSVQVAEENGWKQFEDPETSPEATLGNNRRAVVIDRGLGGLRVLYVSGRPNWEYKFLQRAVAEDDQIDLVGLIRVAKREPKFQFKGRAGEESNPLFRGFNKTDEGTEKYDQPVLVRLNVRDDRELSDGFPKTAEDLYQYHAIIVDDLESEFFSRDQMTLLKDYVSDRGGGFLMLGGQESFQQGKYVGTPLGDLLPVYLDYIRDESPLDNLKLSLTREGWLQPWVRLHETETAEKLRLDSMPPFKVVNRTRDIKPGASVLADVQDGQTGIKYPALVVQRYGNGRSCALLVGDMWRWGLHQTDEKDELGKAWRQMVRWLVSDVPDRIDLEARPVAGDPNHAVKLLLHARGKDFKPLDTASVELTVESALALDKDPSAQSEVPAPVKLMMEPALSEPGLFEATYVPRTTGGFQAKAVVRNEKGVEEGRAEAGWTVDFAADEYRSLKPNRSLLESIARDTKGEVVPAEDLGSFVSSLPERDVPVTENWTRPLWHHPLVFGLALLCLVGEWGVRRWKGMA